jgi:hypothetical protein
MLAATSYFNNARVFGILAILATVFAVSLSHALAPAVRAFFIVCHTAPLDVNVGAALRGRPSVEPFPRRGGHGVPPLHLMV